MTAAFLVAVAVASMLAAHTYQSQRGCGRPASGCGCADSGRAAAGVGTVGPLIGPVVSLMRFVCSIGKVALAVVLSNGGISFGGVVAFIFARPDHPADPDQLDPQGGWRMQSVRLSVC